MLGRAARAVVGSALLWVIACAGEPEGVVLAEQETVGVSRQEVRFTAQGSDQAEPQRCDRADIEQLEGEARALAVAGGCEDVSQCATAPLGVMACGGPREYLVYCATRTDEKELQRVLKQLEQREERFNRQCDVISICLFVPPPEVELVGGVCQAVVPEPLLLP